MEHSAPLRKFFLKNFKNIPSRFPVVDYNGEVETFRQF
jgi:hypothetical protein